MSTEGLARVYPSSILTLPYEDKVDTLDPTEDEETKPTRWKAAYQRAAAEVQSLREENARLFAINQTLLASPTVEASTKRLWQTEDLGDEDEEAVPLQQPPPQPIADDTAQEERLAYEHLMEEHKTALHTLSLLQQHAASLESIIEQWRDKCTEIQTDNGHLQQENAHLRDQVSRTVQTHFEDQLKLSVLHHQSREASPQRLPLHDPSLEMAHAAQQKELERLRAELESNNASQASGKEEALRAELTQLRVELESYQKSGKESSIRQALQQQFREEREQMERTYQSQIEKLELQLHHIRESKSPGDRTEWDAASIAHYLKQHMDTTTVPPALSPLTPHLHMLDQYAEHYQHATSLLRNVFALKPEQDIPRHQTHDAAPRPFLALIQELHRHYVAQCHITQQLSASSKKTLHWEQTLEKLKRAGSAEQRRRREAESQVKALTDLMGDYFAIASTS